MSEGRPLASLLLDSSIPQRQCLGRVLCRDTQFLGKMEDLSRLELATATLLSRVDDMCRQSVPSTTSSANSSYGSGVPATDGAGGAAHKDAGDGLP